MLADLYKFVTSAGTSGLDSDRAAAIATVRSMIGARMYPDVLAEGLVLASGQGALRYQMIFDGSELTQDGDCGLYPSRVQIDVFTSFAVDRDTLGNALRDALHGYAGFMNPHGSPVTGTSVDVLIWDSSIDEYEPDRLLYRRVMDFHVIHN